MRTYADIVPSYEDYVTLQKTTYCSYESESDLWSEGQRRYLSYAFSGIPRDAALLDVACGDGVGLREFSALGFTRVWGVEFNAEKATRARDAGYPVAGDDLHDLRTFGPAAFDVVYSSHTLEHAYYPEKAVSEIRRVLKPGGLLYVVLPYPDRDDFNIRAHGAKEVLGTNVPDDGRTVTEFFMSRSFGLLRRQFDAFREPEIWLFLTRDGEPAGL